jgi:hypothetical protein
MRPRSADVDFMRHLARRLPARERYQDEAHWRVAAAQVAFQLCEMYFTGVAYDVSGGVGSAALDQPQGGPNRGEVTEDPQR